MGRRRATGRKRVGHKESDTQIACVTWFRCQYRRYERLLFSGPNGGFRGKVTAQVMKAEGVVAGVADLILAFPRGGYTMLCIEMKTADGRQSRAQKEWQRDMEDIGRARYVVCRSVDDFIKNVNDYIGSGHGERI